MKVSRQKPHTKPKAQYTLVSISGKNSICSNLEAFALEFGSWHSAGFWDVVQAEEVERR